MISIEYPGYGLLQGIEPTEEVRKNVLFNCSMPVPNTWVFRYFFKSRRYCMARKPSVNVEEFPFEDGQFPACHVCLPRHATSWEFSRVEGVRNTLRRPAKCALCDFSCFFSASPPEASVNFEGVLVVLVSVSEFSSLICIPHRPSSKWR